MNSTLQKTSTSRLVLSVGTAADVMSPNPVSIRDDASVEEAVALLADKAVDAVPVIDKAGRPVGVLTQGDILVHHREKHAVAKGARAAETVTAANSPASKQPEKSDLVLARDIMTPALFSVAPESPSTKVVEQLLKLNVRQLFVVNDAGTLVGSVNALDILRKLESDAE